MHSFMSDPIPRLFEKVINFRCVPFLVLIQFENVLMKRIELISLIFLRSSLEIKTTLSYKCQS